MNKLKFYLYEYKTKTFLFKRFQIFCQILTIIKMKNYLPNPEISFVNTRELLKNNCFIIQYFLN
jgi:hypothetical protein